MTAKVVVKKIAEFKLIRLPAWRNEPTESADILILEYGGKILATTKGVKPALPLGKFYDTLEGQYLLRHLRGRIRFEKLDGAVIKYQAQRGTANSMSGQSVWHKIWFRDGKTEEFRD